VFFHNQNLFTLNNVLISNSIPAAKLNLHSSPYFFKSCLWVSVVRIIIFNDLVIGIATSQPTSKELINPSSLRIKNPQPTIGETSTYGLKKVYPGGKRGDIAEAGTYFAYFPVGKSPEDIVKPHVFGGSRRKKRNEQRLNQIGLNRGGFTIMGNDYPRDASGDIPGARYTQMLHQIGALSDMARQALPKSKQKDRKGTSYYIIKRGGVPIAIGERTGASTRIMLVFARNVGYRKNVKYDYFDIGRNQVEWSLPLHFNRIINRYISRM